jgi:hypothetical protein
VSGWGRRGPGSRGVVDRWRRRGIRVGLSGGDSDVGALGWGQRGLVVAPRCWGGALGVVVCGVHSGGGGGVRKRKCGEDEI